MSHPLRSIRGSKEHTSVVVLYTDFLLLPFYFFPSFYSTAIGLYCAHRCSSLYPVSIIRHVLQYVSFSISILPWTPGESAREKKRDTANNNTIQFQSSGWSFSLSLFVCFGSFSLTPLFFFLFWNNTTIVRESIRSLALSLLIGLHLNNSKWINRHYLNLSRSRVSFLFPYSYS